MGGWGTSSLPRPWPRWRSHAQSDSMQTIRRAIIVVKTTAIDHLLVIRFSVSDAFVVWKERPTLLKLTKNSSFTFLHVRCLWGWQCGDGGGSGGCHSSGCHSGGGGRAAKGGGGGSSHRYIHCAALLNFIPLIQIPSRLFSKSTRTLLKESIPSLCYSKVNQTKSASGFFRNQKQNNHLIDALEMDAKNRPTSPSTQSPIETKHSLSLQNRSRSSIIIP